MATQKLNLTRDQLATFLQNHEQIKQFERLFQIVDEVSPSSDTTGISIQAGNAEAAANEALALIANLAQEIAISSGMADQKAVQALDTLGRIANALEMLAAAPVIQNNNSVVTDYIDFNTTTPAPAVKVGRMHWNGGYTLNLEMTPNVNQAIGESQYYYIKASAAIAKGQLVMFDGSVGSSGVLKGKPATGVTNGQFIMGVAAEAIANNAFGLVSSFGLVRGFNTTGAPYGEVWADGDILYYNPSVAGGLTKNLPQAPTPHVVVAAVVNAASAGSGSVFVRVTAEPTISQLSDVYAPTPVNADVLVYDGVQQRWENVPTSTLPVGTATNLAGGAAGSVPYQTAPGTTTFLPIGTALQVLKVNAGATAPEWVSGAALTKTDDTNVTLTLGGTPATSLLAATSLTLGWTGQLAVSRGGTGVNTTPANGQLLIGNGTGYTVANLTAGTNISISNSAGGITINSSNPGGTVTSVGLAMPTQFTVTNSPVTGSGTLTAAWNNQTANYVLAGPTSGGAAAPTFRALVASDIPALSYVSSVGATAPITSTGGTTPTIGITSAALSKTDDTNVTLTLGGSPTTSLLAATSLTLGWTGTLAVSRGGTGTGTAGIGAFNNITGYTASGATGTTSTNLVFSTSPTLTTPKATTTIGVGNATPSASGAGVTFPATQSASTDPNTLDDYEEGTWTATLKGFTTAGTYQLLNNDNYYTKIGNRVFVQCRVRLDAVTGGGAGFAVISGLPFSKRGSSMAVGALWQINVAYPVAAVNGSPCVAFHTFGASSEVYFPLNVSGGGSEIDITGFSSFDYLHFSIDYEVS